MPSTPEKKAAYNAANKDKQAAQRLFKKLLAAYHRNEEERTNRDRLTPFDGGAKTSTLNKYGIRVHWDKENFKVQTRAPEYPVEDPGNVDPPKPETMTGGHGRSCGKGQSGLSREPESFQATEIYNQSTPGLFLEGF